MLLKFTGAFLTTCLKQLANYVSLDRYVFQNLMTSWVTSIFLRVHVWLAELVLVYGVSSIWFVWKQYYKIGNSTFVEKINQIRSFICYNLLWISVKIRNFGPQTNVANCIEFKKLQESLGTNLLFKIFLCFFLWTQFAWGVFLSFWLSRQNIPVPCFTHHKTRHSWLTALATVEENVTQRRTSCIVSFVIYRNVVSKRKRFVANLALTATIVDQVT